MNIDELIQVTKDFYHDLANYDPEKQNLGDLCLAHMSRFTCYNRFLLGVHNARIINEKQMKNPNYVHFLQNANEGNQTVYDYLALPSQRIGRYTMYFKELMKHTTDDHVDLPGLRASLARAEEIANMREEVDTQLMKIFQSLLRSIQYCPESLMSSQRRMVCYLDVAEIDPLTLKPLQPVTIFLFSDRLIVVKRPSYDMDGLDLCGLDQRVTNDQKEFCIGNSVHTERLKFIGWIHVTELDLYHDPTDVLNTLTLMCNHTSDSLLSLPDTDQATQQSLEAYFQHDQQKHCFSLSLSGGNLSNKAYFQNLANIKSDFIYQFGKVKNEARQNDELIESVYCQWNHHHFFANIYPTNKYHQVANKNDIALFYIEKNNVNIEIVLNHCFMAPNIVGFILPQQEKGTFCFAIRSKCALGNTSHDEISLLTFSSNDTQMARNQLFGNLLACDRDLLRSAQMAASNTMMQPAPTSTHSSGASSHHSRFSMVKQDLIRKTSKSTFKNFFALTSHGHKQKQSEAKNKAHTSSTVSSTSSPSQNSHLGKARASTSGYSEYVLNLEATSRSSSVYSGSLKSQRSHESRLPPGSSNKDEKLLSQFHSSLHRFASESNQKRNYSPSFHPTRTASFDIEVVVLMKKL
ncbi:uncharacterized protein B0P05DRAFT_339269 [Gilbertella persicaria]|uniref:uncharacterized protein n=1 Tax=Gilbertella persicaria TaxID=101096 RepID=UPI00221F780D|nr:uncharacterized protein B0P05DRAFT_339269 [Gilbertella persicaria]KAI8048589.1 hypothetical protein B0P05DRAFT_339269 [Gilbertella persicaria]